MIKNDKNLTIWHYQFGHLNYSDLKYYLNELGIKFNNISNKYCEPCAQPKARKKYNKNPQE